MASIFRSFDSLRTIFRIVSSKSSPPRRWMPSLMTTSFQVPRHFQERGVERASSKVVGYGHRDQPARRSRPRAARTANSGRVVTSATECSGLSATAGGGFGYVRGDFLRGELFAVRLADVAVWPAVAASCVLV